MTQEVDCILLKVIVSENVLHWLVHDIQSFPSLLVAWVHILHIFVQVQKSLFLKHAHEV